MFDWSLEVCLLKASFENTLAVLLCELTVDKLTRYQSENIEDQFTYCIVEFLKLRALDRGAHDFVPSVCYLNGFKLFMFCKAN